MSTIEIVSHCYAGRHKHYASALIYQLSSLVMHRWECNVSACIVMAEHDQRTEQVIQWFTRLIGFHFPLRIINLKLPELGRRSIGRNIAAKSTDADIVWFADVDQVYREGILDRLCEMEWPNDTAMIFPTHIKINKNYKLGDKILDLGKPNLLDIDPNDFRTKRYWRAIGGVQIVKGDFARKYGYLDGQKKWQKPFHGPTEFDTCRCDRLYRLFCKKHGGNIGVDLPGMYRIRHTETTHHDLKRIKREQKEK